MRKPVVKVLFAVLLGLLSLEYWFSMRGIEPYPAPVYPEFSYLLKGRDSIPVIKPDFIVTFDDGTSEKVNYYELFNLLPISHINHLVVKNLNPKSKVDVSPFQDKPFKSFQLGRYTYEFRRTPHLNSKEEVQERDQFLIRELARVTKRTDIKNLHITWYEYDFEFGKGRDMENRRKVYDAFFNLSDSTQS